MAARKRKKVRRRNRGRFSFLYKLLSTLLILAAIVTGCFVFFRVENILVTGQSKYTEAEIIQVAGIVQGDNLFRINKFDVQREVRTQLPYISTISINRKLPDTVLLEITECVPIGALQSEGVWWLMDATGKLLERGDNTLAQGQAILYGLTPLAPSVGTSLVVEESATQKRTSLMELLAVLTAYGMEDKLNFVDVTSINEIRFGYEDRLTVVMPLVSDFSRTVYTFSRTLEEMEQAGDSTLTGTLYFTYEDGSAHLLPERWKPTEVPVPTPSPAADPAPTTEGETGAQGAEE